MPLQLQYPTNTFHRVALAQDVAVSRRQRSRCYSAYDRQEEVNDPSKTQADCRVMSPDLFRNVLAMTVFAHHLTRFSIGNMAVYIFFVLSGYWIARMWVGRYAKSERPFSTFYLSRSLRLIPTLCWSTSSQFWFGRLR